MNQDTRFLIEHIDKVEHRLGAKIDKVVAFQNRLIGMAVVAGAVGSFIVGVLVDVAKQYLHTPKQEGFVHGKSDRR